MKDIFILCIFLLFSLGSNFAQMADFEGTVRILDYPSQRLQFYDNQAEAKVGELWGNISDFTLLSNKGDLRLQALDEIRFIGSNITTQGFQSDLMIKHESGSSSEHGFTLLNNGGNNNYWTFYVLNTSGTMSLSRNGTVVGTFSTSGVYTSSDRRLKKNVESLKPVMPSILSLRPQKYNYITSESPGKSIGFIAQDVKEHFPELVLEDPSDNGELMLQVNYAGFGVLAIKAIQEQQDQIVSQQLRIHKQDEKIDSQSKMIENQHQMIESIQRQMNDLLLRVSTLEEE